MKRELEKKYNPQKIENEIYKKWEERGYFRPEINEGGKPYTIVMPPPNITGKLHIGHAFCDTLQDILCRYKRMKGFSVLWLPGEDHASIATEVKVVEKIKKEQNKSKYDLGREKFLEEAWAWADFYRDNIRNQIRKLGASCDWSREKFTLDEDVNKAVIKTFIDLYKKGLIYKGNRIINWCPECKTALSDAEVEYSEKDGHLWHIKYPIVGEEGYVTVATTRPETMLGDTAVAVHPDDERYAHLKCKKVRLPLVNKEIPVVFDDYVDMEFGTGVVKITPCHDPNDFEVGLRHNLEQIRVLNDDGSINSFGGKYEGMSGADARKQIVNDLDELGLLDKIEDIKHNVGACYRCSTSVEPLTSEQWFVKMKPLAKPAIEAVKNGEVKFVPDRFKKIYFNWMENIKDWCISRQLWWGHQIPVYYCKDCDEVIVSEDAPNKCPKCGSTNLKQDEDVLDTWFSSGLWPFSTLGWPKDTDDLKRYYPNDVLVTGFDIIFFWVARMIFLGIEEMGEPPYHHVYIHGLVRDSKGRKMSKSLGNGVDPIEVIDKYGADVVRFSLVTGNKAGNDTRWQETKVEADRNFANKINNAARFILMNLEDFDSTEDITIISDTDKWIISRMNETVKEITSNIEKYEIGIAAEKLYNFIWNEFCDYYIEFAKVSLNSENEKIKKSCQYTLYSVFMDILKTLHPYMPFLTEHIYSFMPGVNTDKLMLINEKYPEYEDEKKYEYEEENVNNLISAIRNIRNARANMDIPPSKKADAYIVSDEENKEFINSSKGILSKLSSLNTLNFIDNDYDDEECLIVITALGKIFIPLGQLIDKEKEIERLKNEEKKLNGEIERLNKKLSNENFVNKAPEQVVNKEREKLENYKSLLNDVKNSLEKLQ